MTLRLTRQPKKSPVWNDPMFTGMGEVVCVWGGGWGVGVGGGGGGAHPPAQSGCLAPAAWLTGWPSG